MNVKRYLEISKEVQRALRANKPVVAFDSSSAICDTPHGMRLSYLQAREEAARAAGAVPATIAILNGVIYVGLSRAEAEHLCSTAHPQKLSRRDLPVALATGGTGAVTSATGMIAAMLSGIRVFSSAGIGGVRTGSLDISADLQELHSSSIVVVCAGVNPGADSCATLEYLETMGVPVLGLGTADFQTKPEGPVDFFQTERRVSAAEGAKIAKIKWDLGLGGGLLLTCSPPSEATLSHDVLEPALSKTMRQAQAEHVTGQAFTPYLNSYLLQSRPSAGKARFALERHCAAKAAEIAFTLCRL